MNKIKLYLQDTYLELTQKVTWPTWKDLQSSAIVVMIASFIIALIVSLMDFGFSNIMKLIYSMF
ncbi:MAG: preprotein translocase subunit SecE [Bacteroidetes bacterium CG02_land_8_20_14_3_00_31_25]|nr:MAG: preprotein translocase subunit SecE [Bacteroidetes bacterium GWA2_32_17]PIV58614.1 MAG: preprotein translocase subunit SecE [Bacteroidetes bacterium CG02_land_8_20_14_3_00_31_25]PIX32412.1 MAG: preprotein translocase subunit SecE [Bacteroidetes bacterium CG_4_8_14_3_um_filter_31_14]PIY04400.1 MAG: preprotein translocase subunit SecE [Bacteroidetes bacterium CG_4_10_14_3_um_filter_31_20]